jgi:hypothetical protein
LYEPIAVCNGVARAHSNLHTFKMCKLESALAWHARACR